MFCPKCRDEFREGFTHCNICDEMLIEVLPLKEKPSRFTEDGIPLDDIVDIFEYSKDDEAAEVFDVTDDSPAFLCTVNTHEEVALVESLMRSHHIPVMKKWRNAGDATMIYMAVSFTGADLYVPSKLLEQAHELLASVPDDAAEAEDMDDDFNGLMEEHSKKRRERARTLLLLFFIIPTGFVLIVGLLMVLNLY